ncbi:MAG: hypothetical protein R6V77_06550 [Candidatus Cloacimonadaceae bacterium]
MSQTPVRQLIVLLVYIMTIGVIAAYDNSLAVWLNAGDAIVGIGLGCLLFILILRQRQKLNLALAALLIFQIGYYLLRSWVFAPALQALSEQMKPVYETYLERMPRLDFNADAIVWIQNLMLKYQAAIWGSFQILAVFLGFMLFNRHSAFKQRIRLIKFPYPIIYLMIATLALSLFPITRIWGLNALICMSVFYLIQGTAVLSFVWGDYFAKVKLMRTLLIMAVIINYPVLILIALVGIIDNWFDFRKLNVMEEKHESNSN